MISNPERTWLLSTMGWVDHDALWRYDVATGATETIPFGTGRATPHSMTRAATDSWSRTISMGAASS